MNPATRTGLVVFDCDGVLVDSEPIACATVAEGLGKLGLRLTLQEITERYVGISAESMYSDIEARYGRSLSGRDRHVIDAAVDERLATAVLAMPGAANAIQALGDRFACCVASSGTPMRIRGSLAHAGLWTHFEGRVFSASQVEHGKPAPDLFLFAAREMGFAPDRCIVVEDSVTGVRAARAAGMKCLGFLGGSHVRPGHEERLIDAGATLTLAHMTALPECVERLVSGYGCALNRVGPGG